MQNNHIAMSMPLYRKKSFEAFQRRLEAVRPKKSGDATLSDAMQDFMAAASAETLTSLEKGLRTRTLELAGVCYVLILNKKSPTPNGVPSCTVVFTIIEMQLARGIHQICHGICGVFSPFPLS